MVVQHLPERRIPRPPCRETSNSSYDRGPRRVARGGVVPLDRVRPYEPGNHHTG